MCPNWAANGNLMKLLQVSVGSVRIPPTEGSAPLQVMFNLSRELASTGHQVMVLDRAYSRSDPVEDVVDGVLIVRLTVPQIRAGSMPALLQFAVAEFNAIMFAFAVSRFLRANGKSYDVVHLHLISIGLVVAAFNRNLRGRMHYTCHLSQWALATDSLGVLERLHLRVDAFLMRRVQRVFAVNEAAKRSFVSFGGIEPERIAVLPHGVDSDFFRPRSEDAVRSQYGLAGRTSVLFVGRLARIKGVFELLAAADEVINRRGHEDVVFVLAGPWSFPGVDKPIGIDELEGFVRAHELTGRVIFTGPLPLRELGALYSACDVFVCPSLAEAGPLVTLEAMASGLPIVGTRVGGMPDQIVEGSNGFLVDAGDWMALADRIAFLVDNPGEQARMGANSRRRAVAEFDWSSIAAKQEQAYLK
jgi:glycosyltransferase involved in cell wall biosynthesis